MDADLVRLLFSFTGGRISRAKYWMAAVIWCAVAIVWFLLVTASDFGMPFMVLGFVLVVPAVWSSIAVGIKRLQDRDKSGWWLLLFYLLPTVLDVGSDFAQEPQRFMLSTLSLIIGIWGFVELGCLRGTVGPNRYGPDPLPLRQATAGTTGPSNHSPVP